VASSLDQFFIGSSFGSWIRVEPVIEFAATSCVTSHPVAALDGRTMVPHARGIGLGKAEPTLITAYLSH